MLHHLLLFMTEIEWKWWKSVHKDKKFFLFQKARDVIPIFFHFNQLATQLSELI